MSEHGNAGTSQVLLAFFAGAFVGGVVALLLAPESGRETRERVKKLGQDLGERSAGLGQAARQAFDRARGATKEAFEKAKAGATEEASV